MSGVGKSWYIRAAAESVGWERTLWLNTEDPITHFPVHPYTPKEPWGVVDVQDRDIEHVLAKYIKPALAAATKGKWLYDLFAFDGISETDLRNFASIEEAGGSRDKRQLWGTQHDDFLRFVWATRRGQRTPRPIGLGCHTIVTARTKEVDHPTAGVGDDGLAITIYRPALRGWVGKNIDHYFDQVLYVESLGKLRRVYVQPTGKVHVKNRWEHKMKANHIPVKPWGSGNIWEEVTELCQD